MANHETLTELFTDIADAIRAKKGTSGAIVADNFPDEISSIEGGGGGGSDDYFWTEIVYDAGMTYDSSTIGFRAEGEVDVELQYSYDKTNWNNYTLGTDVTGDVGQKIYWKNNKDYLSIDNNNYIEVNAPKYFKVGGRINSLINDIDGTGCYPYAFKNLFYGTRVTDASELILNKHVAPNCYQSMFDGCRSLTTVPALPATVLQQSCYTFMFANCDHLTTVPALPATILPNSCYAYMFTGCSALKVYAESGEGHNVPWTIPTNGTVQAVRTCSGMFDGVQTDSVPASFKFEAGQQYTFYTQNTPIA